MKRMIKSTIIFWIIQVLLAYFVIDKFGTMTYIVIISLMYAWLISPAVYCLYISKEELEYDSDKEEWERQTINNLVKNLSVTVEEAMNIMEIPLNERQHLLDSFEKAEE